MSYTEAIKHHRKHHQEDSFRAGYKDAILGKPRQRRQMVCPAYAHGVHFGVMEKEELNKGEK